MSRASKLTLLGTSVFAAGTIVFVHFQQKFEQQVWGVEPVLGHRGSLGIHLLTNS